jgi:CBS domain-containing protein
MHGMLKSVGGAMNQNVETIDLDSTAYEAARRMKDKKVSSLLVVESKNNKPSGIVTERDLARRVCAEGACSKDVQVKDIMSDTLVTIDPNSPIEVAADNMIQNKVRHLLVTDKDGKAIGIITPTDFGKVLKENIDMDEVNTLILKAMQEESAYIS